MGPPKDKLAGINLRETAAEEDVCVNIHNLQLRINGGTGPRFFFLSGPECVSMLPKVLKVS